MGFVYTRIHIDRLYSDPFRSFQVWQGNSKEVQERETGSMIRRKINEVDGYAFFVGVCTLFQHCLSMIQQHRKHKLAWDTALQ